MTDWLSLQETLARANDDSMGRKLLWVSQEEYEALYIIVDEMMLAQKLAKHGDDTDSSDRILV